MNRHLLLALLALAFAAPVAAQDGPYLYVTYFECDPAAVADVDAARGGLDAALNAHVAAGDILSWGWSSHHTGGRWNRLSYFLAPTLDALIAFQDAWQAEIGRDHAPARDALRRGCPSHDDYIWRQIASSQAPAQVGARAPAAYSTYFRCEQAGLRRVDALVRESVVPLLDALVEEGALTAWRWHGHVLGGAFNRLLVLDGASHAATLRAQDLLGERMGERVGEAFSELCGSHQDYLWNVTSSR